MKRRRVFFAPEAEDDLRQLYDWIADRAGVAVAFGYMERLRKWCGRLQDASERGMTRDEIRPGLRITNFEGRVTIAFYFEDEKVMILRLFYGGRDWEKLL